MPIEDVKDKGVVVTGAGRGIGRALAAKMAAGGARVVVNDIDPDTATKTAAEIGAHAIPGDAATERGVEELIAKASAHLGTSSSAAAGGASSDNSGIDIWFGNAGVAYARGLDGTAEADWATSIEVNVLAHVRAARILVPRWLERGHGRYVMTASAAGLLTMLGDPAYSVTKHGALAFAEWLSATYRHRGIVVQAICPQGVKTAMLSGSGPLEELLSHDTALEPEDVANAAFDALKDDRFLILPHPEVAGYYQTRAAQPDRWLGGMNKLQRRLDEAAAKEDE